MADTVVFQTTAATPPSGTVVSTEEVTTLNGGAVTAQQVQRILLALRTGDGVVIDLPGDASNGLKVQGTLTISAGAATAANQSTVIGHLDGVEALLGTIDTDTSALAGAVAGNEVQVDVLTLPALPAGTNNIGDVDIASIAAGDNNIGNVDILTLPALPAGANTIGAVTDAGPSIEGTSTYTASANMTTAADIGPAPTSGQKSILLQTCISTDTAMSITLQMETTPGSERVKFFLPANGSVIFIPRYPKKLGTADKKWQAIASVSGNVAISTTTRSEA